MSAPVLNPVQQRFVSAILQGLSQGEAYKAAGYPGAKAVTADLARKKGQAVAKGAAVRDALARARAAAQRRLDLTADDIVAMLIEARTIALGSDPPQANAAVAAAMGIAKLLGLVVDRSEVNVVRNKPSLFPTAQLELSEAEWKRQFDPSNNPT